MRIRTFFAWVLFFVLGMGLGYYLAINQIIDRGELRSPLVKTEETPRPLQKYSFGELRQRSFIPKEIKLAEAVATESAFSSRIFRFETEAGQISGMANIPNGDGPFPAVVMIRGFVDKEEYQTGTGTKRAAEVFARHGYLTLAPDFLGYGGSDEESQEELKARFEKMVTVLQLLVSLPDLTVIDSRKVAIWGHSNGGQIALSVLAITGRELPTILWAPVSKPFPYSILYYTDELTDNGKYLRKVVADFEQLYDVEDFSVTNYLDWISAPIQIHQGMADESVPRDWTDQLVKKLEGHGLTVGYSVYPDADHNLEPWWDEVVERDLIFLSKQWK